MRISDWSSDVCSSYLLDDVGAGARQAFHDLERCGGIGIAGGDEGGEGAAPGGLERREASLDAAARFGLGAHNSTPRALATVNTSLSPRPHRFMTMIWSRAICGASLRTCASACAGSSAGMLPSIRPPSWKAPSPPRSVAEPYSARPISGPPEAPGPTP